MKSRQKDSKQKIAQTILYVYSDAPKFGRPDFGAFGNRPVCDLSGFQTLSINRKILSGYRTSGPFTLHASNRTI